MNSLATPEQLETERLALKLAALPIVRNARERVRANLLADRVAATPEGRLGLDRALDQWVTELAMREANNDYHRPALVWSADNHQRAWFGHLYPGGAVAIDNPDNINREAHCDGAAAYEVIGKFNANRAASFSIMVETNVEHHGLMGKNLGTIILRDLKTEPDGSFKVSVDPHPANGRANHIQSEPGRIAVYTRDSLSDWNQVPAELSIRRTDGATAPPKRGEEEMAARIAAHLPDFASYWLNFANTFLGYPPANTMVGPNGRDGGWGYLAAGRFELADDEAIVITTVNGGGDYTGAQISDTWTMSPDPVHHTASLNKSQTKPNPDGTTTYVVAPLDPGYANWLDTCGLHAGWFLFRWQSMPASATAGELLRGVAFVKVKDIDAAMPKGAPRADLDYRRAQIVARAAGRAWRIREK